MLFLLNELTQVRLLDSETIGGQKNGTISIPFQVTSPVIAPWSLLISPPPLRRTLSSAD